MSPETYPSTIKFVEMISLTEDSLIIMHVEY